jgi:hypothetical protein
MEEMESLTVYTVRTWICREVANPIRIQKITRFRTSNCVVHILSAISVSGDVCQFFLRWQFRISIGEISTHCAFRSTGNTVESLGVYQDTTTFRYL